MGRPSTSLASETALPTSGAAEEDALQGALEVLAPLVRLLINAGVDYTEFCSALKGIFIAQAHASLAASQRKSTDSALSLLSGVHRKDVRKWRESALVQKPGRKMSLTTQLFACWAQDRLFLDRFKRLKPLPRAGPEPSFESLSRRISRDVHPFTILSEALHLGLVRIETKAGVEYVVPNPQGFVPPAGSREAMQLLADNLQAHAATAVDNLLGHPAKLEQAVFAEGVTRESAEILGQLARKLWAEMRTEMISKATHLYAQDRGRTDADQKLRLGVYFSQMGHAVAEPVVAEDLALAKPKQDEEG